MDRRTRVRFLTHCQLTCLGGSERAHCKCGSATDCEMRRVPGFVEARQEATLRLMRIIRAEITNPDEESVETFDPADAWLRIAERTGE